MHIALAFNKTIDAFTPCAPLHFSEASYTHISASTIDEVIKHLEIAVRAQPNNSFFKACLGDFLINGAHNVSATPLLAEKLLKEAIQLNKESSFAHASLGALLRQKNYKASLVLFRKAIKLKETCAFSHLQIGALTFYNQDCRLNIHQETLHRHLTRSITLQPHNPLAHILLGSFYSQKESTQYEKLTRHHFKQALKQNANSSLAHTGLGKHYAKIGMHDKALYHLTFALQINKCNSIAHRSLGELLMTSDPERALPHFKLAKECDYAYNTTDIINEDTPIHHLQLLIKTNPSHAKAHALLGELYRKESNISASHYHLNQSLALNPYDDFTHSRLGALLALSDPALALNHLKQAVELDPNNSFAQAHLGALFLYGGNNVAIDVDAAYSALQAAITIDESNVYAHARLGAFFLRYSDNGRQALYHLERAIALDDTCLLAHALLGELFQTGATDVQADHARSCVHLVRATELDPASSFAFTRLGILHMPHDLFKAQFYLLKALEIYPDSHQASSYLGALFTMLAVQDPFENPHALYKSAYHYLNKARTRSYKSRVWQVFYGVFLLREKLHFPTDALQGSKLLREGYKSMKPATRLYLRPILAAIIGSEEPLNEIESDLLAQEISELSI